MKKRPDHGRFFILSVVDFFGIHVMVGHPVESNLVPRRAWFAIVDIRVDRDSPSWSELAPDLDVFRVEQADEVFHDDVDAVFMEVAMVAE